MTTHRVVLELSAGEYGQLQAKAAAGQLDAGAWALKAIRGALGRREGRRAQERRSREAGLELLSLLARSAGSGRAGRPTEGRPT